MKLRMQKNGSYRYTTFNYVTPQRRLLWLQALRSIIRGVPVDIAIAKVKGE